MFTFITNNLLWAEGPEILAFLVFVFVVGLFWFRPLAYAAAGTLLGCFLFFRNPERVCAPAQQDDSVLICPADGRVVAVHTNADSTQKVAIFLSVADVHVNWMPLSGVVEKTVYKPGAFFMASSPESTVANECMETTVVDATGRRVCVRQIAGKIARRVRCWVREGQEVVAGQKFGMIRFGSRVEVVLPASASIAVAVGQKVYGGATVLGRWQ